MQQEFPCPKCGAQIAVGQRFCGNCGERFEYRCGRCGASTESGSGFCTSCGSKLPKEKPPAEPPINRINTLNEARTEARNVKHQPQGKAGRYFILIAVIIFIGAILFVIGVSSQGGTSNFLGGGFTFGGKAPPSTPSTTPTPSPNTPSPPAQPTTNPEPPTVKPPIDSPHLTSSQVINVVERLSPECRPPSTGSG